MEFVHLHATMDARVTRSRTSRAEDMAARCTRSKRLLRDVTALLALSPPPQQQKRARTARRGLGAPDSDAGPTAASPSAREAACSGMEVDVRRVAYAAAADDGGATRNSGAAPRGGNGARGGGGTAVVSRQRGALPRRGARACGHAGARSTCPATRTMQPEQCNPNNATRTMQQQDKHRPTRESATSASTTARCP